MAERRTGASEQRETIREVPIATLQQADWNPREITDERMESLKASIRDDEAFMWQRPILAMADGTVYAGNQRLAACAELGWTTVPVIMEDVPEQVAQQRAIKDNASWGQWNDETLALMLTDMPDASRAHLGFTDDEMVGILRTLTDQQMPPADDGAGTYVQNEEGERGKTPEEKMEGWAEGTVRNVVLYYDPVTHERVAQLLSDIREYLNLESNAPAVSVVLEEAYAHHCADGERPEPV